MIYMAEKNREIVRMGLSSGAKTKLDEAADKRDMKLIGVLSRLVEWFVDQHTTMQSIILGLIDEKDAPDVIDLIHKRLSQSALPLTPVEQAKKLVAGADRRYAEKKKKRKK